MKPEKDSIKPFVKGICSDVWSLHHIIKAMEKENKWLKRKLDKLTAKYVK